MKLKYILLFLFALILKSGFTQPVEEWTQRYNGSANSFDIVSKILVDNDNNVYIFGSGNQTGSATDFLIIKYSPDGNILWTELFNGSGNSFDHINSACFDNSGNIYVTGYTTDFESRNLITTAKFDTSGNFIWSNVFSKQGYIIGDGKDIIVDNSDNILVCGSIKREIGFFDIEVIKYSPEGDEIWSNTFNGEGNGHDNPVTLKNDNLDNIIIAGTSKSLSTDSDMIIIKYDSSSNLIWKKTFNGTADLGDVLTSMVLDTESNIYFCGNKFNTQSSYDYFYAKLDQNGNIIWSGSYNGIGNSIDIPSSIILDSFNNVYITGFSRAGMDLGSEDFLTIKLDQDGNTGWVRNFDGIANGMDQANSIAVDNYGNVYVGGGSDTGNIHLVYSLIKYDPQGIFQWEKNYFHSQIPEDFIYNVALDNMNNIYVTGISFSTITDYDIATVKYSRTVGINQSQNYLPEKFFLRQNYPNPFNPSTVIGYDLNVSGFVSLKIYDILGKKITTLVNENQQAGTHEVLWDASDSPNGFYFYEMKVEKYSSVKKMLLIK
ncbi:MAG TPA: T9SS type A sorting domain-containing protein [Ignavibacteria bacterium]|nr:T9SS type A sorting domain-containing protein [Ignavibacteria bacterium]HQY52721.1 T9SS type A sorting domain-containing protein [Ignavibacteria bacterium]HRB01033.1 T9SS type A sorting domain-containing protein [Ignavibacteria bacterium]